ncbi:MAG TPA: non-heme iron oxygenase ferredoxin subunit [Gammaproteobacteria bacterium]|nr:non-heme iron oxygenase ferredoxin subunit [Gammaproteobacteria bacterium]
MTQWVTVAKPSEIENQGCKLIEISNVAIAIFNLDGQFFAIKDDCPHQHMPLADGLVEGDTITCPYHTAKFNIKTGQLLAPPACDNLTIFPCRVVDGQIQIEV